MTGARRPLPPPQSYLLLSCSMSHSRSCAKRRRSVRLCPAISRTNATGSSLCRVDRASGRFDTRSARASRRDRSRPPLSRSCSALAEHHHPSFRVARSMLPPAAALRRKRRRGDCVQTSSREAVSRAHGRSTHGVRIQLSPWLSHAHGRDPIALLDGDLDVRPKPADVDVANVDVHNWFRGRQPLGERIRKHALRGYGA